MTIVSRSVVFRPFAGLARLVPFLAAKESDRQSSIQTLVVVEEVTVASWAYPTDFDRPVVAVIRFWDRDPDHLSQAAKFIWKLEGRVREARLLQRRWLTEEWTIHFRGDLELEAFKDRFLAQFPDVKLIQTQPSIQTQFVSRGA